jgi:hypothetical protein
MKRALALLLLLPSCGWAQVPNAERPLPPPPPPPPLIEPKVIPFGSANFRFLAPDLADPVLVGVQMKPLPKEPFTAIGAMRISLGSQGVDVDPRLLADLLTPDLFRLDVSSVKDALTGHTIVTVYIFDDSIDCATREKPACGVVEYDWDVEGHDVAKRDYR